MYSSTVPNEYLGLILGADLYRDLVVSLDTGSGLWLMYVMA